MVRGPPSFAVPLACRNDRASPGAPTARQPPAGGRGRRMSMGGGAALDEFEESHTMATAHCRHCRRHGSQPHAAQDRRAPMDARARRCALRASWLLLAAAVGANSSLGRRQSTSHDGRRVGIVYEPWHAPAYWFMRQNSTMPLSVEEIVRANGSRVLSDIFAPPHRPLDQGMGFWWHATPAGGRYCIYRKRDDEEVGYVPDCPNITQTLTRQASELVGAGIDFVVVDSTNAFTCSGSVPDTCHATSRLDGPGCLGMSCQGDVLELRPTEVLFEARASTRCSLPLLRAAVPTPVNPSLLCLPLICHTRCVKRRIRWRRHGGKHWVSLEERCPELNNSTAEGLIGYAAARRSTENPRSLRFCEADGVPRNGTAWFQYHSLDAVCRAGDRMSAFVGFVH